MGRGRGRRRATHYDTGDERGKGRERHLEMAKGLLLPRATPPSAKEVKERGEVSILVSFFLSPSSLLSWDGMRSVSFPRGPNRVASLPPLLCARPRAFLKKRGRKDPSSPPCSIPSRLAACKLSCQIICLGWPHSLCTVRKKGILSS